MMVNSERGPRLYGRLAERETLAGLVDGVRRGRGAAYVVRGKPGTGKTALLNYTAGLAADLWLARAAGLASEKELAYAGLHQLCAPMFHLIARLPEPERGVLEIVFGMRTGPAPDRFRVSLALLRLLSEAAAERPLICVIDDIHWLDRASARILAFVARRLPAQSALVLFATRGLTADLAGLPGITLGALRDTDARDLLASAARWPLDERVRDQLVAETQGNPGRLLESLRGLSPTQLAGGFGLLDVLPSLISGSLIRRLAALPAQTRLFLLVAAADPTGDPALLWRAATALRIPREAAFPAMEDHLVAFGDRVVFRDPRVRSTVYHCAPLRDRGVAHDALAEATDPQAAPDRRAWHRSYAVWEPDEQVAAELERTAARAQARGGLPAFAAFLKRASAATPEAALGTDRTLAAAEAMLEAGDHDAAAKLLEVAEAWILDDRRRAHGDLVRAQVAYAAGRVGNAPRLLLDAALRLERLDVSQAQVAYLDAISAAVFAGRLAAPGESAADVAHALRQAPFAGSPDAPACLLVGLAACLGEGYKAAPGLRQALDGFGRDMTARQELRWLPLACYAALHLWDDQAWFTLSSRYVQLARELGALGHLPLALSSLACLHRLTGEPAAAQPLTEEARAIADATGGRLSRYDALSLAALEGRHDAALELIDGARQDAALRGEGLGVAATKWATAMLYNGLGRYGEALSAAEEADRYAGAPTTGGWVMAELIEAAARTGQPERAAGAIRQLSERASATGTDWALGVQARSLALLSDGEPAEELYRAAIRHLRQSRARLDLSRAHLLYGEWLRRENRRADAREHLRRAYETMTAIGADGFAQRARRELLATGELVRRRTGERAADLSAQEKQIAVLARDGHTNTEIGAELFLSPRTVEWHLRKVFMKLGITSRRQLRNAVCDAT
jgi:DNA-binding CsgD family transcriptional regulator